MRRLELFFSSVVFLAFTAGIGWAAEDPLLIGRVAVAAGAVQYRTAGGEWSAALANEPIANGTSLRTGTDAEAALHGLGAQVSLAPSSEADILRFDRDVLQIFLAGGRIGVHLGSFDAAKTVEIDLPQGGMWLDAPGDYDIDAANAQSPVTVQVFAGGVRFGGGLDASRIAKPARDWFSDWWESEDDDADLTAPATPPLAGAAALAANGRWELDGKFGNVWFPSDVPADWVPYRDGVWRFLAPWGWTWIDNAPWGFAPAHYGRWAQIDGRWGWVPGHRVAAGDYAPAVVGFFGTAGIGLSRPGDIGTVPAIAWFPLAPDENLGDADGNYANRRFATAVLRTSFAAGLPVAGAIIDDVPERRFLDAPVILGALGIAPTGMPTAVAAKAPAAVAAAAVNPSTVAPQPPSEAEAAPVRQPFVVALRDAPARVERVVHEVRRKLHLATAVLRARRLASVYHPPHNRRRFAAARGGA